MKNKVNRYIFQIISVIVLVFIISGCNNLSKQVIENNSKYTSQAISLNSSYPIVFLHGWGVKIEDEKTWKYAIENYLNGENGYSYFSTDLNKMLFKEDALNLPTNSLPEKTMFRISHYRDSENETSISGLGFIGVIPKKHIGDTLYYKPWYPLYPNLSRTSYAERVKVLIDNILRATGSSKVILVAYSNGGIVARAFIKWYDGASSVAKLLTIATNNDGYVYLPLRAYQLALLYNQNMQAMGELQEVIETEHFEDEDTGVKKSYIGWLNQGWLELCAEKGLEYATIAGDINTPLIKDTDCIVNVDDAALEGAVFNEVINGEVHEDIIESHKTADLIKKWIFNDVLLNDEQAHTNILVLDSNSEKKLFYEAYSTISAGNGFQILANEKITFEASHQIDLNSEFSVEPGASFDAVIE
ncbi:esterase/lipase family protein [Candidatus Margulisiibacteriota bacterium]